MIFIVDNAFPCGGEDLLMCAAKRMYLSHLCYLLKFVKIGCKVGAPVHSLCRQEKDRSYRTLF